MRRQGIVRLELDFVSSPGAYATGLFFYDDGEIILPH